SFVPERLQLAGCGQPLERLPLEHVIRPHRPQHTGFEAEEAAVYPVLRSRLLLKRTHGAVAIELRDSERKLRPDDGYRRRGLLAPVVVEQAPQVDVSDTVGVCDADGFVAFQRLGRATQTATRGGIGTRLQAPNPHATGPSFTIHEVLNQL